MKQLTALLLVFTMIVFACTDYNVVPKPQERVITQTVYKSSRIVTDSTPWKVFIMMWGQSNACYYTNSAISGKTIHGVHFFDQKNLNWVDSGSYKQIQTGAGLTTYKWSPLLGLSEELVISRPDYDLYFSFMGQAGINLHDDYNPTKNTNNRFRQYVNATNSAVAQGGPFDEVIFIWVQGESDQSPTYSAEYFTNQKKLFDSLKAIFYVDKFIDYAIYGASPEVVNQAKDSVAALRNDTKVIRIPIVVTGPTATRTYPDVGQVHMTKYGLGIFGDSLLVECLKQ